MAILENDYIDNGKLILLHLTLPKMTTMTSINYTNLSPNSLLDECPSCKSSRYLKPNLRILVNPVCYHRLCEDCVNRIFATGPAPCPYEGCGKILRKNKFKEPNFEDLVVEKEVDVRQRVSKTFNKRREDFATLKEYNDYLEEVEDIIYKLSNDIDVEENQAKLQEYEQKNRSAILENSRRQQFDEEQQELRNKYEKERRSKALQLEREMELAEREIRQQAEQDYVKELSTSNANPLTVRAKIQQETLRKIAEKRRQLENQLLMPPPPISGLFRGLHGDGNGNEKKVQTPFTPFMGDYEKEPLYIPRDDYYDPLMDKIRNNPLCQAAGYIVEDAYKLDLSQAFFGIGVYIEKEKASKTISAA